jgi:hypothetical protein
MKRIFNFFREQYILYTAFGPIQRKWLRFLKNNPDIQYKGKLGVKCNNRLGYKACCLGQFGLMTDICHWNEIDLVNSIIERDYPMNLDIQMYGFVDGEGCYLNPGKMSLSLINDTTSWLHVYNACLNDPKGYFTKKV